jgi:hypothetical protein
MGGSLSVTGRVQRIKNCGPMTAICLSKAEAKAAAVVKSALKKQAVKVWKTTNAAVKKAAKEAAEAVAVEAEQM